MKKFLAISLLIISLSSIFILVNSALAQSSDCVTGPNTVCVEQVNPLSLTGSTAGVQTLLGNAIKAILGVIGSFALVMVVYGGFLMLVSRGNTELVKKGKEVLIWAVIGIIVIFGSYAIVNFVITGIQGGGGGASTTGGGTTTNCTAPYNCYASSYAAQQALGTGNVQCDGGSCGNNQICCKATPPEELTPTCVNNGGICTTSSGCTGGTPAGTILSNSYDCSIGEICCKF